LVVIFFTGCTVDKFDSRLKFFNNILTPVFIHSKFSEKRDSLIHCDDCYSNINNLYFYARKDTVEIGLHGALYDEYLKSNHKEFLKIFVFSPDTLKKYGWKKQKMII
jgi:hypothetical protein